MREILKKVRRRLAARELAAAEARRVLDKEVLDDLRERHRGSNDKIDGLRTRLKRAQTEIDSQLDLMGGRTNLSPEVGRVLMHVASQRLTMIRVHDLIEMCEVVRDLRERDVEGSFVEAGTAMGGSAILLTAAKGPDRDLTVYDVFGRIPPPTEEDGKDVHTRYAKIARGEAKGMAGDEYYGYQKDLLGRVTASFASAGYPIEDHRVRLVQGTFEEALHPDGPVAFAHLDGDWYESTMVSLQRVIPYLSLGGVVLIDDYNSWSGCAKAVDEFFADRTDFERIEGSKLRLVRIAETPGVITEGRGMAGDSRPR